MKSVRLTFAARAKRFTSVCLLLALVTGILLPGGASADKLLNRSVMISSGDVSVSATYDIKFSLSDVSDPLGSIDFLFCSDNPVPDQPCTAPDGLDASAVVLASQTGTSGFSISPLSSANNIIISRVPAKPTASNLEFLFNNIVNPSATGSYYIRMSTYASADASGTPTNQGGLAYDITNPVQVQADVPPFITFCTGVTISGYDCGQANGDYIDFGEFSPSRTSTGSQQLLIATNAANGASVSVLGTTMTSGNNIINPLNTSASANAGTSQFGLNLVANSRPNIGQNPSGPGSGVSIANNYAAPNSFRFNNGETVASSTQPVLSKLLTVSYIVDVPPGQAPGVYTTTMTYVALGNF